MRFSHLYLFVTITTLMKPHVQLEQYFPEWMLEMVQRRVPLLVPSLVGWVDCAVDVVAFNEMGLNRM